MGSTPRSRSSRRGTELAGGGRASDFIRTLLAFITSPRNRLNRPDSDRVAPVRRVCRYATGDGREARTLVSPSRTGTMPLRPEIIIRNARIWARCRNARAVTSRSARLSSPPPLSRIRNQPVHVTRRVVDNGIGQWAREFARLINISHFRRSLRAVTSGIRGGAGVGRRSPYTRYTPELRTRGSPSGASSSSRRGARVTPWERKSRERAATARDTSLTLPTRTPHSPRQSSTKGDS